MARNSEKAQSFFSQWNTLVEEDGPQKGSRRPKMTTECDNLLDAEKWRKDVIRDLTQKISFITAANGVAENKIRDVNDEINKVMGTRRRWEKRIFELGGADLTKVKIAADLEGKSLPGTRGYKYYGVAKDLPGVKEKFDEHAKEVERQDKRAKKRSLQEILKKLGPEYYGGEEDKDLEALEMKREKSLVAEALREYKVNKSRNGNSTGTNKNKNKNKNEDPISDTEEEELHSFLRGGAAEVVSGADMGGDIESEVLKRKNALLSRYL